MRPAVLAAAALVAAAASAQAPAPDVAIPTLALAPPAVATRSPAEAAEEDAAVYAVRYDVPLDEALARLHAQTDSVGETDRIARTYRDRLAGITIEHRPVYRIVVHLTGRAPVADGSIDTGGLVVPIVYRTGAAATRDRILAAIGRHQAEIRAALIDPPGMGVDPASGRLLVAVGADDIDASDGAELAERIGGIAGVPVRIVAPGHGIDLAVAGGGRIEHRDPEHRRVARCTAGFVVTDGSQAALATAAHCPDAAEYVDANGTRTPLTLIGAWGAGTQDVQLHALPISPSPLFRAGADGDGLRAVTGWMLRSSLRAGDFVCHQGLTTDYSCAELRLTDYAPPGDLCAGPCPATWLVVAGPDCARGDSGGPVFIGDTAIAIVKGGSFRADGACTAYYAMSTDYLPSGWTLAH